jgi:sugar lactone lactonase YvrE
VNGLGWSPLPTPPSGLGESPFWHPDEQALYWCDIPGRALHRWVPKAHAASDPARGTHTQWPLPAEPGCIAPLPGGMLMLAARDGLFVFDPATGGRSLLAPPPYDPAQQRFNDPQGRLWLSTLSDARRPEAALYRWAAGRLEQVLDGVTVGNGIAFTPDGRTMYFSDTGPHRIEAFDFDAAAGTLSRRRLFAQLPLKPSADVLKSDLSNYGGRPDGAAVDIEGHYWSAQYEGQRLLRFAPDGRVVEDIALPVRCATMPCFGGPDLRTLFLTTARDKRPADELARQTWAGHVLHRQLEVPGLPVNFARR